MLERLERVLYHAYRLALLIGLLAVVLTPLHRDATLSADVVAVDGDRIEVRGPTDGLAVGSEVRVYRFNPGWTREIGWAEVTALRDDGFDARYARRTYHWPMGAQGMLTDGDADAMSVNLGSDHGLEPGTTLNVYDERRKVGRVRVVSVDDASSATVRRLSGRALVGDVVTAFTVANQVAWFHGPLLAVFEWVAILGVLGLWLWSVVSPLPGRGVAAVRGWVVRGWEAGGAPLRVVVHAALGVVIVPVAVEIYWESLLIFLHRFVGVGTSLRPWTEAVQYGGTVVLGIVWAAILFRTLRSPAVAIWRAIRYRVPPLPTVPWVRGLIVWGLHLFVFYAFSSTLTGFLAGNLNGIIKLGWGRQGVVQAFAQIPDGLWFMLTHTPSIHSWDDVFGLARLTLWSLTICGCLLGYWHTVLSIAWKRNPIRNIDFTPTGWIVNAICYGPLLGGVVYRVVQHPPTGVDPGLAGGPVWALQLFAEFLLNLLYTLSIWNLGTKFGVMVDKGVVSRGFYSFVRHPSYTLESLMFITLGLTGYVTGLHYAVAFLWPVKYFFRSERDDIFMGESNPDYVEYREKVRWKYLPGII